MTNATGARPRGRPPHPGLLTPAEERVLVHLRRGLTNPEIGRELGLRRATVKYHVANILAKLEVSSRRDIVDEEYRRATPIARSWLSIILRPLVLTTALFATVAAVTVVMLFRSETQPSTPSPSVAATAATPGASSTPPTIEQLRARLLAVPRVAAGEPCPMTPDRAQDPDGTRYPGAGPLYVSGWSSRLQLTPWPDGWLGVKWLARLEGANDGAPVLVRGAAVDGAGQVLFTGESPADASTPDLVLGPNRVFDAHFDKPGCYGLQFDTVLGSHVLVFDVREQVSFTTAPPTTEFDNPAGAPLTVRLFGSYETPVVLSDGPGQPDLASVDEARYWSGVTSPQGVTVFTDGLRELCLRPVGGAEHCVTDNVVFDGFPSWAPDGSTILFESTRTGRRGVWMMDADGANQHELGAVEGASDWFPSWSPDGSRIAFCSDRDGGWHIYTMAGDGSDVQQVTSGPGSDWAPLYSPDGAWIALISNREERPEVWVVRPDGTGLQRVTETNGTWVDAVVWR